MSDRQLLSTTAGDGKAERLRVVQFFLQFISIGCINCVNELKGEKQRVIPVGKEKRKRINLACFCEWLLICHCFVPPWLRWNNWIGSQTMIYYPAGRGMLTAWPAWMIGYPRNACDLHSCASEMSARKTLLNPTQSLQLYLLKWHYHAARRSTSFCKPLLVNIYWKFSVLLLEVIVISPGLAS